MAGRRRVYRIGLNVAEINYKDVQKVKKGFTLIELLIVIAIIAILALIAVPNFLEAQTRAKVARAESDMRAIATAVETYAVDFSTLPLDADDHSFYNPYADFGMWNQHWWYPRLTTPVAYISSVPMDPFNQSRQQFDQQTAVLYQGEPPYPYPYTTSGCFDNTKGQPPYHGGRPSSYGLLSLGPNTTFDSAAQLGINDTYDPTNGTMSRGDIIRQGPGAGQAR